MFFNAVSLWHAPAHTAYLLRSRHLDIHIHPVSVVCSLLSSMLCGRELLLGRLESLCRLLHVKSSVEAFEAWHLLAWTPGHAPSKHEWQSAATALQGARQQLCSAEFQAMVLCARTWV